MKTLKEQFIKLDTKKEMLLHFIDMMSKPDLTPEMVTEIMKLKLKDNEQELRKVARSM